MKLRTQQTGRKMIGITNYNFTYIKNIGPYGFMTLKACLPAMKIIAAQMNLKLNRTDNFNIVKAVMERMILEN